VIQLRFKSNSDLYLPITTALLEQPVDCGHYAVQSCTN